MSGSVGPAGRSITSGLVPGFIFTVSSSPNGFGGILPGFRYQRRLKTSSGSGCAAAPTAAGRSAACAVMIDSAIPSTSSLRYAAAGEGPSLAFENGAVVGVRRADQHLVRRDAGLLRRDLPSPPPAPPAPPRDCPPRPSPTSSSRRRAPTRGHTADRERSRPCARLKPPGMFSGNSFGVISTAAAPARKAAGFSAASPVDVMSEHRRKAVRMVVMVPRCP